VTAVLLPHDDAGDGRTVVLLHARPTDRRMWREHLPLLGAAGYRAIAPDLPGYGGAVLPERHETPPAHDVLETLDHLGVDRFALVGNSLGALVGLQTALAAPDRLDGLLLIGYRRHDQPASDLLDRAWEQERTALAAGDLDGAVRAGADAWLSPEAPPETRAHVAEMLRGNLELRRAHGEPPRAADPTPAELRQLDGRVTVAVGEQDMPDFHTGGAVLAEATGAGQVVVVPGAAHLVPLDQPLWTCGLVQGLLHRSARGSRT
jgi:3-oxoadipate enol-lactonase/4-carboxymuconolactone decarboxylase